MGTSTHSTHSIPPHRCVLVQVVLQCLYIPRNYMYMTIIMCLIGLGKDIDSVVLEEDYRGFMDWLQCYEQPTMNNLVDHNGRTMWFKVLWPLLYYCDHYYHYRVRLVHLHPKVHVCCTCFGMPVYCSYL